MNKMLLVCISFSGTKYVQKKHVLQTEKKKVTRNGFVKCYRCFIFLRKRSHSVHIEVQNNAFFHMKRGYLKHMENKVRSYITSRLFQLVFWPEIVHSVSFEVQIPQRFSATCIPDINNSCIRKADSSQGDTEVIASLFQSFASLIKVMNSVIKLNFRIFFSSRFCSRIPQGEERLNGYNVS